MTTDDRQNILRTHIERGSTALISIDVQNDFCAKDGYFAKTGADLSRIDSAARRLVDLIDAARVAGVLVVFVRSHYDPIFLSDAQNARRRRVGRLIPLCLRDNWGADFFAIKPLPAEPIVTKHRYDGFYNTDLELILRSNGIKNLVLTGVATNTCVETTLRSAFVRDFEVTLVDDCSAARTQQAHESTLHNVRYCFGIVARADEIEQEWRRNGEGTPTGTRDATGERK